ncbi:MAG: ECF transporter S component [Candidatus Syntrophosphaera sp.]
MSPRVKIFFALILLLAFLVLVFGFYMDNLVLQAVSFGALSLLLLVLNGGKKWVAGFRLMLPFLISLILIYSLFGLFKVRTPDGEPGSMPFWLQFGLNRILLFVNSVLAFQTFFACVSFDDLLRLPLKIGIQKYVILGKVLSNTAFSAYEELSLHQRLIPSEQQRKLSFGHKFRARLAVLLSLLMSLANEAREKGQLIDNRIIHCHGQKQHGTGLWYQNLGFIVLVTVATMIIPIPIPGGGFFNFGDVMIVFVGLYAGRKAGALAGGIGSAIADLLLFPLFAPITFVVKGVEGYICGLAHGKRGFAQFILPLIGSGFIVLGYFLGEWFMPQLGKAVALADLPVNIVQASAGFIGGRALFEAARYLDI